MFVPFFVPFFLLGGWIKGAIAGAGAAILWSLDSKVEVLLTMREQHAERSFISLMIMDLLFQPWAADVHVKTNKHILCKPLYLFWFWWSFSFFLVFFFSFWVFCCWLFGLSLTSPNSKRKSEYRIAKSIPGLKCQWFQLKVVDAFTELNIPKLNCKFNSRSEWLVQLKRKPQLSFLFSPSFYLLSDDEFPVAGRGDPQQK